ncbi:unnamed protein product [Protopolystoma xenopodis]|uniref:Cadherin domain-containing protein n=1 Tax=Protopolystoma xenopodis TaxID=117903 RepID=A0A448WS95_9PLAT|nr:unnamed protein product [Protopolystoma xenopodis]
MRQHSDWLYVRRCFIGSFFLSFTSAFSLVTCLLLTHIGFEISLSLLLILPSYALLANFYMHATSHSILTEVYPFHSHWPLSLSVPFTYSGDAHGLIYSLERTQGSSFSIEPRTGLVRVALPLDRETLAVHQLDVLVSDTTTFLPDQVDHFADRTEGRISFQLGQEKRRTFNVSASATRQHTASARILVRLIDVNDSPPRFLSPTSTEGIGGHGVHLSGRMNATSGALLVSELEAPGLLLTQLRAVSDDEADNAVITYRLLTRQPEFALNETTGNFTHYSRRIVGTVDTIVLYLILKQYGIIHNQEFYAT